MYRELLSEVIQGNDWAKLQDPCSEAELAEVERVVGYPFPADLKAVLLETNGDNWFLLSAQQMIRHVEINRSIYPEYLEPEEYAAIDRHIFFATNGCGDYYCYRVSETGEVDTSGVYIWEHELFETRYVAKNIEDAIHKYYGNEI